MENGASVFFCVHCERKLDLVKFQLETFSLFFQSQPELVILIAPIKLCSYKKSV